MIEEKVPGQGKWHKTIQALRSGLWRLDKGERLAGSAVGYTMTEFMKDNELG